MNKVYFGDCRDSMRQMAKDGIKVQTCITSPPYYGLRDYGTATWEGGDINCDHSTPRSRGDDIKKGDKQGTSLGSRPNTQRVCKCGAIRKDLQIGLEESPKEFIDNLVEVFACVWDILEDNGTLWVNLGDSYYNYRPGKGQRVVANSIASQKASEFEHCAKRGNKLDGYKEKDLMGMPWRLAFALQDFGWYLRQDIIWHKPNPMPESVQDRCTKAHEYIFLLTKKPHYYFDNKSIKEPVKEDWGTRDRTSGKYHNEGSGLTPHSGLEKSYEMANKRSVWTVNTKPYKGAHFAVYPEELIEPCVLASTKVGDVILDPFFGSGTTGQVAQNLGRKWIGCELNKDYEELQNERVKQQGLELL
jgi:DNA modification methylase